MRPLIVGILNTTPDSFSDRERFATVEAAVEAGLTMADAGADWLDVGGESTRPGSTPVAEAEEIGRVIPVIEGLAQRLGGRVRISIDTYKAGTARAALQAGASIVNDVSGGRLEPEILAVTAQAHAAIVLGHLRGRPATMGQNVQFRDVVAEVSEELEICIAQARVAGCSDIWADPGIGFGKQGRHNLSLLKRLPALSASLGVPLMVGVSRKRFIGDIIEKPVHERTFGTAAAVAAAILGGAAAVRVHDVAAMRDVALVAQAIRDA